MNPESIAVAALRDLSQQAHGRDSHSQLSAATNLQAQALDATTMSSGTPNSSTKKGSSASPTTVMKDQQAAKKQPKQQMIKFPVEPTIIQIIKKPRTFMNHSYRDFSKVPAEVGEVVPTDISAMTFPQKVHHILSQEEYTRCISWLPHGRAFRISIPKMFEARVCQKYFGHSRYSSFLRQLSNHSVKHITQGPDRNAYYHEFMLRGLPHLCKYMPKPKDARRLIPDPANEPDFYAISQKYPLPAGSDGNNMQQQAAAVAVQEVATPVAAPKAQVTLPLTPQASGIVRRASEMSNASGYQHMPPVKRARSNNSEATSYGGPSSAHQPMTATSSLETAAQQLLATLVNSSQNHSNNNAQQQQQQPPINAAALLAATSKLGMPAPVQAYTPAPAASNMPLSPAPAPQMVQQDAWSTLRNPQMQTALDRNAAVLSALRATMANQISMSSAPSQQQQQPMQQPLQQQQQTQPIQQQQTQGPDPAAALAAALLQQAAANGQNPLSSLAALLGGRM